MATAILLKDVEGLGQRGSVVDISAGYLRNYLVPRKLAQATTRASLEAAQKKVEADQLAEREAQERAGEYTTLLNKTVLTIQHQAGDDGRLYGSVTAQEIADAIRAARGLKIDKRKVKLAEPIKQVGTHMVDIEVTNSMTATVKTMVVARK